MGVLQELLTDIVTLVLFPLVQGAQHQLLILKLVQSLLGKQNQRCGFSHISRVLPPYIAEKTCLLRKATVQETWSILACPFLAL